MVRGDLITQRSGQPHARHDGQALRPNGSLALSPDNTHLKNGKRAENDEQFRQEAKLSIRSKIVVGATDSGSCADSFE